MRWPSHLYIIGILIMGPYIYIYKPLRTWVDEFIPYYGNNGSLDPGTYGYGYIVLHRSCVFFWIEMSSWHHSEYCIFLSCQVFFWLKSWETPLFWLKIVFFLCLGEISKLNYFSWWGERVSNHQVIWKMPRFFGQIKISEALLEMDQHLHRQGSVFSRYLRGPKIHGDHRPPKGRELYRAYKQPTHGTCAMYFYRKVYHVTSFHQRIGFWQLKRLFPGIDMGRGKWASGCRTGLFPL